MPGVTISSGYGAGGSVVAPRVAELLGVQLVDRAVSSTVAQELHVTVEEAEQGEAKRSVAERFFGALVPLTGTAGPPIDPSLADDAAEFREHTERILRQKLADGCVILGRAGAAAFVNEPDVLRVRLFGAKEDRIRQGAEVQGISEDEARQRQPETDKAREHYMRRLYHTDQADPALYHMQLDSTAIPLETCAEIVAEAYRAFLKRV
ncbi:MAG TPA: cytidylate kinase-like family protein [Jatrophihabitans sp.]|nr:cytidylate kinase-like family protein [Jatrophihabitans sp.]